MQRSTIFRLALIVFALGAFSFMGVFAQGGQTLVIGTTDTVGKGGLEPAEAFSNYNSHLFRMTRQKLCTIKPGTSQVIGQLAKSCDPAEIVSNDGLTYTFELRDGVTFTDGTELTAANVVFSFKRNLALNGDPVFLISGVEDVEAVDELTVEFTLSSPDGTFLKKISGTNAAQILSFNSVTLNADGEQVEVDRDTGEILGEPDLDATLEATENDPNATIGTGPYELVEFTSGQLAVLETFENYWGCDVEPQVQCPKINRIIERHFNTSPSMAAALQDGSIDVAWRSLNIPDINRLSESGNFNRFAPPSSSSVRYANFDVANAPFDDLRIRKAISFAIDRSAIVNRVFEGVNDPIFSLVPPGFPAQTDVFPERDLERASELLQQAGFSADSPAEINLWFETSGHYGTTEPDVAAVVKDSLDEVPELDVQLQSIDFAGLISAATEDRTANFFLLGWFPDFQDSINFINPFIGSGTEALGIFFNELTDKGFEVLEGSDTAQILADRGLELNADNVVQVVNDLIATALEETDPAIREDVLTKLQQIKADTVPQIPLWSNTSRFITLTQSNITNVVQDATLWLRPWLIEKQ